MQAAILPWMQDPEKYSIDQDNDTDDLTGQQIEQPERGLKKLDDRWERAKDFALDGGLTADDLTQERIKYDAKRAALEDELEGLQVHREPDYWSWVSAEMELSQLLNAEDIDLFQLEEWEDIIENTGVRVDIFPDPEGVGWEPRISVNESGEPETVSHDTQQERNLARIIVYWQGGPG